VTNPRLVQADLDQVLNPGEAVVGLQVRSIAKAGFFRGRIGVILSLSWLILIIALALLFRLRGKPEGLPRTALA
jgi:hypothetical protein